MVDVARASGRPVAIVLGEPFWLTLWTHLHLMERETERALEARRDRVDVGYMTGLAVNAPAGLDAERKEVSDAIDVYQLGADGVAARTAARRRRGLALVARIRAGAVLQDSAEVMSG